MLNNKKILITGGTGSFGKKFIKTVLERYNPEKITEDETIMLANDIASRIEDELTYPGEIRVTVSREARMTKIAN